MIAADSKVIDPFLEECEKAFAKSKGIKYKTPVLKEKEVHRDACRATKSKPEVKWAMNPKFRSGHYHSRQKVLKAKENEEHLEFITAILNAVESKATEDDIAADARATVKVHDSWFSTEDDFLAKIQRVIQFDTHIGYISKTRVEGVPLVLAGQADDQQQLDSPSPPPVTENKRKKAAKGAQKEAGSDTATVSPKKKKNKSLVKDAQAADLMESEDHPHEEDGKKGKKKKKQPKKVTPDEEPHEDQHSASEASPAKKKKKPKKKQKLDLESMGPEELEEVIKRKTKKLKAEKKKSKKLKKQKKGQQTEEERFDGVNDRSGRSSPVACQSCWRRGTRS